MYAIAEIAGKQFKIKENQFLFTPKLCDIKDGETTEFNKIFLYADNEGNIELGTPSLSNVKVVAKKIEDFRDKKIIVFKKKRRKGYKKKQGHRQVLSKIHIEQIVKI